MKKPHQMKGHYFFDNEAKVWIRKNYVDSIGYSDGAAFEQQLYEIVKSSKDVSVLSDELESHICNWATLYFLSKKRSNVLRPFASLFKGRSVLEVGCRAGSITRFLGERGA